MRWCLVALRAASWRRDPQAGLLLTESHCHVGKTNGQWQASIDYRLPSAALTCAGFAKPTPGRSCACAVLRTSSAIAFAYTVETCPEHPTWSSRGFARLSSFMDASGINIRAVVWLGSPSRGWSIGFRSSHETKSVTIRRLLRSARLAGRCWLYGSVKRARKKQPPSSRGFSMARPLSSGIIRRRTRAIPERSPQDLSLFSACRIAVLLRDDLGDRRSLTDTWAGQA